MKPILLEVLAYAPTQFYHCTHCEVVFKEHGIGDKIHAEQLQCSIPDDLFRDYSQLSQWVRSVLERYGDRVVVKVVDVASAEGFFAVLRHRVRKFPAVIVNGKEKFVGLDFARAQALIERQLTAQPT